MIDIDNPLKWLLSELPAYIAPDQLAELMARYDAQKQRYYDAVKLRDLERKIQFARHWTNTDKRAERIQRWQAQLDKLKARIQ
jgi:hypothetical protein